LTAVDGKEPFLSRWSRRKLDAKEDASADTQQMTEAPAAVPVAPIPPTMAPPAAGTSEGITPEYREFFDPQVDEKLRQTALRKLFSDPHFNVMDGLDTYIDDYSIPDPIPDAMLRQLNQAKALFLFDDEEKEGAAAAGLSAGESETAAALLGSEASAQAELPAPAAAATDADAADSAVPLRSGPRVVP
jgi:hypothetical protein